MMTADDARRIRELCEEHLVGGGDVAAQFSALEAHVLAEVPHATLYDLMAVLETRLFEANEELSSLRAKAELTKRMVDYVRETGFASGIIPT
jgi:hypothetical protein